MAVATAMPQTAASPLARDLATAICAVIRKFGPGDTAATSQTEATARRWEYQCILYSLDHQQILGSQRRAVLQDGQLHRRMRTVSVTIIRQHAIRLVVDDVVIAIDGFGPDPEEGRAQRV